MGYLRILVLFMLVFFTAKAVSQERTEPVPPRVLILVDESIYPDLKEGLDTYGAIIFEEHGIRCVARPDDYYAMKPPKIRAVLKKEYHLRTLNFFHHTRALRISVSLSTVMGWWMVATTGNPRRRIPRRP